MAPGPESWHLVRSGLQIGTAGLRIISRCGRLACVDFQTWASGLQQSPDLGVLPAGISRSGRPTSPNLRVWAPNPPVFPGLGGSCTLTSPGLGVRRPHLEIGGPCAPRPGDCGGVPGANLRFWAPRPGLPSPSRQAPKTGRPPTRHFVWLKDIKISICQMWAPTSGINPRLASANSGSGRRHRQVWAEGALVSPGLGGRGRRHSRVWAPRPWNLRVWADPARQHLQVGATGPGLLQIGVFWA